MATKVAIAKRREGALRRLAVATTQIAGELGIEPPVLREFSRDPGYLEAEHLDVMATWLEGVVAAVKPAPLLKALVESPEVTEPPTEPPTEPAGQPEPTELTAEGSNDGNQKKRAASER